MATFVTLVDYTPQGRQTIKQSPDRAAAFVETAKAAGVTVKDLYWTAGAHDGILIFEAPDDRTASALMLSLAQGGNVHTKTLRAYDRPEMLEILSNVK